MEDVKTRLAIERFNADTARDPNDAYAHLNMGIWWHWKRKYARALELYNKAIELDARFPYALCARAGLLATCPDAAYRNGAAAIRDATAALEIAHEKRGLTTNWKRRMYLGTLAAACAEIADFDLAIDIQRKTREFAVTLYAEREVDEALSRLESGLPIRKDRGLVHYSAARPRRDHLDTR